MSFGDVLKEDKVFLLVDGEIVENIIRFNYSNKNRRNKII